jgi:hypothetical protein
LRTSHWTDKVFVVVRHVAGLRTELLVLMAAELIALRYYALIADATQSPLLRQVTGQILSDELGHVGFHCDHLGWAVGAWPAPLRRIVAMTWMVFLHAVAVVVAWDHRKVIRGAGESMRSFVRDCSEGFREARGRIFGT